MTSLFDDPTEVAILDAIRETDAQYRDQGGIDAVEAGAIAHEFLGRHDRDERCLDCGRAGKPLLARARAMFRGEPEGTPVRVRVPASAGMAEEPQDEAHGQATADRAGDSAGPLPARARRTDPATSHAAAASIHSLTGRQQAVLDLFWTVGHMTDEEVEHHYGERGEPDQSVSGLRTRRHELVEQGFLWDTLQRRTTASGRSSIVWGLAAAGLRATRRSEAA